MITLKIRITTVSPRFVAMAGFLAVVLAAICFFTDFPKLNLRPVIPAACDQRCLCSASLVVSQITIWRFPSGLWPNKGFYPLLRSSVHDYAHLQHSSTLHVCLGLHLHGTLKVSQRCTDERLRPYQVFSGHKHSPAFVHGLQIPKVFQSPLQTLHSPDLSFRLSGQAPVCSKRHHSLRQHSVKQLQVIISDRSLRDRASSQSNFWGKSNKQLLGMELCWEAAK